MYHTKIIIDEDSEKVEKIILPELKDFKSKRVKYTIKKSKEGLVIDIQAEDAAALRAMMNSVAVVLEVYEKTKNVIKNE
jgi:tRNA threonylcarbamoyladenosine modification (KEOPS) complex  Pcc1 subunit